MNYLGKKPKNPAQNPRCPKKPASLRWFSALLTAILLLTAHPAPAEQPEGPPDGDFDFGGSSGMQTLTEENFAADDLPKGYTEKCKTPGRVEKVRYVNSDGSREVKSAMVYLPAGYDDSDKPYNVLYILHGASGSPANYLDTARVTHIQCLLDNMIAGGDLEPLIVVAATYYPTEGFARFQPLAKQVEVTAVFPRELVEDVIPAVESKYRTYAESVDEAGITASRDHRGIAGFSLGGVATWYMFLQKMNVFRWFLPISEASWDDGEGGTTGIWDSSVSAQVLYDAVVEQGYVKDDFRLFVATGTEDEAFGIATTQMVSLLEYADMFKPGENTSCSMMAGGTHTLDAVCVYLYHILPALFTGNQYPDGKSASD